MNPADPFLEATIRTATPLALAAIGECVTQRAGVINIGLEGIILSGAFGALVGATVGTAGMGFLAAAGAGMGLASVFALFVLRMRTDQIITGIALNLLALGLTGALYRAFYGTTGASLTIPTIGPVEIPFLATMPLLGAALFAQPLITYAVYLLIPAIWWWLYRTHAGLALRAVGEQTEAASVAGIAPERLRWIAILFGGAMGGLGGATLVLAQAGTFAEGMSAGRGFIAIAIVVLGRWHPGGVALAALLFGAASALQFVFQAMDLALPYHLFLALPYVLTLLALAGVAGRVRAPAMLGRS
ncbi:MAG: ABC transporter permease [Gemmatimonadaceae bacterium]